MSLADIQAMKILKLLKQNVYNVANLTKKPYQAYLTPIAFRETSININSNSTQNGTSRMRIFPQFTSQDIVLGYANYYNGSVGSPTNNANNISVKASIEINGNIVPVTFNGDGTRTVTITPGKIIYSDPTPCIINPTDTVYIRTYFDAGTGGYIPINTRLCMINSVKDGFTAGSDLTDSGTVTDTTLTDSYTASIILGATKDKKNSYLILGDSIADGTGDEIQVANGGKGFIARALTSQGLPWNKISMGGETVDYALRNLYMRRPFFNDHNNVIVNYATNDLSTSSVLSTVQANMIKMWTYLHNLGLIVYQTTISPKTTSTDNWLTLTNQSVLGGTAETNRLAINAWLRDTSANGAVAQSNGALYKVLDTAQAVEDSATGKWKIYNNGNPVFSGTVTSATANNITCNTMNFAYRDLDSGYVVKITGGTGSGQIVSIDNNAGATNQFATKTNFGTVPDATSTFSIYKVPTADGTHPSRWAHIDMSAYINV